jgi:CO/xanthine dehydrogenase Mo-binding subunit
VGVLEDSPVSRRTFLKGTGALVVAFSVPATLRPDEALAVVARTRQTGPAYVAHDQLDSWIAVAADNTVTVFTGKVELGTGVSTVWRQIAAEELDVDIGKIKVVLGDTWYSPDQGFTAGSQSTKTNWAGGLRQAAAEARRVLLELASQRLGVPAAQLAVKSGVVSAGDKSVSYGELIGGKRFETKLITRGSSSNTRVVARAEPKKPSEYKVVGKSIRRVDIPERVRGTHLYVQNVKVPGMLHGRVVRPPGIAAKLVRVKDFKRRQSGLVRVVVKNSFVGVVAEREEQAIRAARELQVEWEVPRVFPADYGAFYRSMVEQTPKTTRVLVNDGNVEAALGGAGKVVHSIYTHPYQMHGSMGAACAVADVKKDEATVWTPVQGSYQLRQALAKALGMEERKVHVIFTEGAGCYGLNGADDVSIAAAFMSQEVGRPVRVQFMRADEHAWENYGNPLVMDLRAGLDANGTIVGWDYFGWTASRGGRPGPPGNLPSGYLAGFAAEPPAPSPPPFPPLGPDTLNSTPPYVRAGEGTVTNARVVSYTVDSPVFTGPLRSPSRLQNTFANESFMDELVVAANADPVEFRLRHLSDPRLIDVTKKVAEISNWQPGVPPHKRVDKRGIARGRGISIVQYESIDGYAAVVVDITVSPKTGYIRVTDVYVAQDCGIIVNPDGCKQQIEGCVVQGISRSLKEEVRFNSRRVTSVDWRTYPIFRFTEMPRLHIALIDRPDKPAVGTGELVITNMAGAINNALFDATGVRMKTLPFTPKRVKAALAEAK